MGAAVERPAPDTAGRAHSAATGAPASGQRGDAARSGSLADSSAAYTSGNPPPITSPPVPVGQPLVAQRVER